MLLDICPMYSRRLSQFLELIMTRKVGYAVRYLSCVQSQAVTVPRVDNDKKC